MSPRSPGRMALPAAFRATAWLVAAVVALAIHLGILALSWDLQLLPAPTAGQEGLRISMAPLGRGSPVALAPPAGNVEAPPRGPAPPAPSRPALPPAPQEAPAATPTPPRLAAAAETAAPVAADPPKEAAVADPPGIPAPVPRARPRHLERVDRSRAAAPAADGDAGMPADGSISGLTASPDGTSPADTGGQVAGLPASPSTAPAPAGNGAGQAQLHAYLSRLQGIMQRNRRYPAAALAERRQGVVLLGFSLHRSGRVLGGRVIRTSGHALLDREALDLLYRVAPLPPFPPGIAAERLDLEVPIRFDR